MKKFPLPEPIVSLVLAQQALREHYASSKLTFTFDGKLVGDIGEAIAHDVFGVDLVHGSSEAVDGVAPDGRTVQVKASGTGRGPAFRNTSAVADHLLFFHLDFRECSAKLLYNGPETLVRQLLPESFVNQRVISVNQVLEANTRVAETQRLRPARRH